MSINNIGGRLQAWSDSTARIASAVIAGERQGWRSYLAFLGPTVIVSVAYIDPGNFATNIQGGAQFGYMLLWVVVLANLMAMLFQSLSAKLGIITGKSLAMHCRDRLPRPLVYFMWIASEIAAMATDLAEFLGASIGLTLLFGLPLLASFTIVGIGTYLVLLLQGYGFRPMEIVIAGFVSIISLSYLAELFIAQPDLGLVLYSSLVPHLAGKESVLLSVGIIGATVMPHALYLHSSLTANRIATRSDADRRKLLHYSNIEVIFALCIAGLVNMAMLTMAAAVFFFTGNQNVADIETAYRTLVPLLGVSAAGIFLLSLLASGFSSSIVGTMAGQVIMQDFIRFQIPLWVRRLITMIPPFIIIALGLNPTRSLVLSQVVLSLVLPIPIIALVWFTSQRNIMGEFVNRKITRVAAVLGCTAIVLLNVILLFLIAGVRIPFLAN